MPVRITLLCALLFALRAETAPTPPPNVVVIYCDDLGCGDLGCFGNTEVKTPRLDGMARDGLRLTRFYTAQAVCSASRSALMTGCYPNRVGIRGALGPDSKVGLNPDETTIAEVLKSRDYATGIFGKWHLGDHPTFRPTRQGFDEWVGIPYSNDMWPVKYDGTPGKNYPPLPWMNNDTVVRTLDAAGQQDEFTRDLTDAAIAFIRRNAAAGKPFFAYIPHPMPHVPLATSAAFKDVSKWGPIGNVVEELDASVGRVLDTLRELGLEQNTLVIFSSDNGPWLNFGDHAGSTGGLREGKGTSFEGGVRVPFIARWPGKITPGVVTNQVAATIDVLPTVAALTGAALPQHQIDGVDLRPLLLERDPAWKRPPLFIHYHGQGPHDPLQAVVSGDWKLVLPHTHRHYTPNKTGRNGVPVPTINKSAPLALYHLPTDPAETTDVQAAHPDILRELQTLADAHWAEITANARKPGMAPAPTTPQ